MIDTMSLEEMRGYRGRQEVPADFDAFWEKQKAELPSHPTYELREKAVGLA